MRKSKEILRSIWSEFVYGGHLLSFGTVSIVCTVAILLNIKITWDFLVIVYLGTISCCLYGRYKNFDKDILTNPERCQYFKKYVKKIPLIIFCFIVINIGILLYFNKISVLLFAISLILLSFLYDIFLKKITKRIIGFKNFFVSLLFTLWIIFLIFYYSLPLTLSVILILIFFYLRFFIGTSFSDIKDIESDKEEGLLTLASVLGERNLINILSTINCLVAIPIIIGAYFHLLPLYSLALLLSIPYSFYYFEKLKDRKISAAYLYNIVVDGELIMWSIFILIGKIVLWLNFF